MHDPEIKASVIAALMTGQGTSECARRYGVPKQTVDRWRVEMNGTFSELGSGQSWLPERGIDWAENFERYVDDTLYGMRVQVAYLTRPDVLERSDYGSIANAHGTFADRIARIAETFGRIDSAGRRQLDEAAPAA